MASIDLDKMLVKIKNSQWALADIDWDAAGLECGQEKVFSLGRIRVVDQHFNLAANLHALNAASDTGTLMHGCGNARHLAFGATRAKRAREKRNPPQPFR